MKTIIAAILVSLTLVGCGGKEYIIKPEIQEVSKPVYVSPAPPDVPKPDLLTPKLVPEDIKDPGKVAQYYKADIIQLLGLIDVYEMILDQYRKASADTAKMQEEVDRIFKENKEKIIKLYEGTTNNQ